MFELLTFSRNNEKALAKSVASLAALQEIVVKALLVLSVQNTELSGDVLELAEGHQLLSAQINRMAQTQYKLANHLIEWEYGAKRELLISELKEHKQAVVFGVYAAFVNSNRHQASKNGKDFSAALCKAFGTNTPEERNVTYIDKLSIDEQELLFKLLQSWIYLCTDEFGINDIFDRFAISNKRKQELCERIRVAVEMQGADNYIDWYANQEALFEDDINEIDDTEIRFADKDIIKRYIDFDDEKIRAVIAQYEACFGTDKLDIYNPDNYEEIEKRIQKINPAISREAVVGIYHCGGDVLLTTHAMYADNKKFEYSLFNENNLALAATGGEKYRLMLPEWDGINSTLEIDADMPALKEMLLSLAKLRTASTDVTHSVCCAHLLRELNGIAENHPEQAWARKFKEHLLRMKRAKDKAIAAGKDCLSLFTIQKYKREYDVIIKEAYAQNPIAEPVRKKRGRVKRGKILALIDRLKKYKGAVCLFLEKLGVPFDNNQAERDIRNIKTKTKVCGCFRSRTGAEEYMGLMSFISTARKNGFDSYHAVKMVLSGQINQFFGVGC